MPLRRFRRSDADYSPRTSLWPRWSQDARRNRIARGWIAAGSRERPALRAEIHPPTGPSRRRMSARTRRGSSRSSPFVCHLSLVLGPTVRGMTASIRLCVMDRTVGTRSRQASHRKQPGRTTALRRLAACANAVGRGGCRYVSLLLEGSSYRRARNVWTCGGREPAAMAAESHATSLQYIAPSGDPMMSGAYAQ